MQLPNYPKTSKKYDPTSVPQLYFNIEGERCDYGGCVYDFSEDCWKILTTFASCPIQGELQYTFLHVILCLATIEFD